MKKLFLLVLVLVLFRCTKKNEADKALYGKWMWVSSSTIEVVELADSFKKSVYDNPPAQTPLWNEWVPFLEWFTSQGDWYCNNGVMYIENITVRRDGKVIRNDISQEWKYIIDDPETVRFHNGASWRTFKLQ